MSNFRLHVDGPFWRRATVLAFFLAPIGYVGLIVPVAIHEVLGHGGAALLVGGRFDGFVLKWDGMGYAMAAPAPDAHVSHSILILAAGPGATTVVGVALLIAVWWVRRSLALRMTLLVLSLSCLLEGPPYLLWNAYHPVGCGDVGRILALLDAAGSSAVTFWRWIFMLTGGLVSLAATIGLLALLFQAIEESLGNGERLHGVRRAAILCVLALPGSAAWFVFDWNQVAPGIGLLPCVVGAASVGLTAAGLYWVSLEPRRSPDLRNISLRQLIACWGAAVVVLAGILLWFAEGVTWGSYWEQASRDIRNELAASTAASSPTADVAALASPDDEVRYQAVRRIVERSQSARPTPQEVAALFDAIRHDPDWRIKVRAMAALPRMEERQQAIDVLVAATRDREPESSGGGNVPLYATRYLADLHAHEALDAVADWVRYLESGTPYGDDIHELLLAASKRHLARLESSRGRTAP